jgi:hypothetical protein
MTVLQLLFEHLPERYIDAVINNMFNREDLQREAGCIESELLTLFDWEQSRQGYDFWENVLSSIMDDHELPSIPVDIAYCPSTYFISKNNLYIMNSFDTGINVCFEVDFKKLNTIIDLDKKEKIYSILN